MQNGLQNPKKGTYSAKTYFLKMLLNLNLMELKGSRQVVSLLLCYDFAII